MCRKIHTSLIWEKFKKFTHCCLYILKYLFPANILSSFSAHGVLLYSLTISEMIWWQPLQRTTSRGEKWIITMMYLQIFLFYRKKNSMDDFEFHSPWFLSIHQSLNIYHIFWFHNQSICFTEPFFNFSYQKEFRVSSTDEMISSHITIWVFIPAIHAVIEANNAFGNIFERYLPEITFSQLAFSISKYNFALAFFALINSRSNRALCLVKHETISSKSILRSTATEFEKSNSAPSGNVTKQV